MSETQKTADDYVDQEFGRRRVAGGAANALALVAGLWSIFQLAIARHLLLNPEFVRAIHLAFALALVYLSFPAVKGPRIIAALEKRGPRFAFLHTRSINAVDLVLAGLAALAALYFVIDYEGIAQRQGALIGRDMCVGVALVVLLLEAARRALGKPLPIIALVFILYSFFSEYMPGLLASKAASLRKVVNQLSMNTEGIYGIPLDVSASTVFLFVLFGAMLERAGGGQYFIELAISLLGRFKGGPAKAAVLASGLTGMVSGSSIANTVTTGTFTIPLMKKAGYPATKAGAIEVAASTNGQLMPPIMGAAAFIIMVYCGLSYVDLVRAAFIPAIISYIALIYITHLEASKLGLRGMSRAELPPFFRTFLRGAHFLIPLVFLLYQLIILRRTPQYSAYYAIVALMALVVLRHMMRAFATEVSFGVAIGGALSEIWGSLVAGARCMMPIGVAVAAAGIIVGIVNLGLGSVIVDLVAAASFGNLYLMLLITAVVSLILGMGLPTTANYIVMATLTVPVIVSLGGELGLAIPLVAAHLFCFYFGILADDTPPVGLSAYAAAAISGADPIKTGIQGFKYDIRTGILPFMFVFNTDLLLIGVSSWLHAAVIFATGIVAMFAFAALTQGWLMAKNRVHEALLLAAACIILLRVDLFVGLLPIGKAGCYLVGVACFAAAHLLQLPRRARAQRAVS